MNDSFVGISNGPAEAASAVLSALAGLAAICDRYGGYIQEIRVSESIYDSIALQFLTVGRPRLEGKYAHGIITINHQDKQIQIRVAK